MASLGSKLQLAISVDPVQILLGCAWIVVEFLVTDGSAQGRSFQVVGLVDISVGWEDVAHDHKVNLASMGQLDTVQSKEATEKGMWILLDMLYIYIFFFGVQQYKTDARLDTYLVSLRNKFFSLPLNKRYRLSHTTYVEVILQDLAHKLVFRVVDSLNDEAVVL